MKVKIVFKNKTSVVMKNIEEFSQTGDTVELIYMYRKMRVKGTVNFVKKAYEIEGDKNENKWAFVSKLWRRCFFKGRP